MKKIISLILVFVMVFGLAACGSKQEAEVPAAPEAPAETEAPAEYEEPTGERTMGLILRDEFRNLVSGGMSSAQKIADSLLSNAVIEFSGASAPMEEGYLAGFSAEIFGFEEAVMFGPAIGSIPFVGYIFVLADAAEAESFTENLLANADPRWNICVEADETVADYEGNLVFFVMCPNE